MRFLNAFLFSLLYQEKELIGHAILSSVSSHVLKDMVQVPYSSGSTCDTWKRVQSARSTHCKDLAGTQCLALGTQCPTSGT
mmetsp:Transcript_25027/g.34856  ORF Transcript_25027/g.34856 Transcript_25027/m.34856 type:complete len:81 (+) Transcript_25027:30-272(+)